MFARIISVAALLALALLPLAAQSPSNGSQADVVLLNGTVLTVDPSDRTVEGLAIRGRVIVADRKSVV